MKAITRIYALSGLALTVILISSAPSFAQHWVKIDSFNVRHQLPVWNHVYFLNEQFGFVFGEGNFSPQPAVFSTTPVLFRTTNGGQSWSKLSTGTMSGMICGMHFVDQQRGYAAVTASPLIGDSGYSNPGGGVFETIDGGNTWKQLSPPGFSFSDVYAIGNAVFALPGLFSYKPTPQSALLQDTKGIWQTSDRGSTWSWETGTSPSYRAGGYNISGDGDRIVVSDAAAGQSTTGVAVSTDLGGHWAYRPFVPGADLDHASFISRHTKTILADADTDHTITSTTCHLERSTDLGKNWQVVFQFFSGDTFTPDDSVFVETLDGYGCIDYAQFYRPDATLDKNGFLRTTDDGVTWKEVGGPPGRYLKTFSVVGKGAVVYALDPHGVLWKTTDGGDGTLSSTPPHQITLSHMLSIARQDTLVMAECDSANVTTAFSYAACDGAVLDSIVMNNLFSTRTQINHVTQPGIELDTALTTIIPSQAGTYSLQVRAVYRYDDQLTNDTSFHLTVVVKPSPAILSIDRHDTIDFGEQSLCTAHTVSDSFHIKNLGCESLQVDSVWLLQDQPTNDFTLTGPTKNNYSLTRFDSTRQYRYSYKASLVANETARIVVKTSVGFDTIYLKGAGVADSRHVTCSIDTLYASVCDSIDGVLHLTNTTCRTITLDSLLVASPISILPNQLPLGLRSGQSTTITVRFVPSVAGSQSLQLKAAMRMIVGTDTTHFDTILSVPVTAQSGTPAIAALDSTLDLGNVSVCSHASGVVHFASAGCDSLHVMSESLQSANGWALTNVHQAVLAVGASDSSMLTFYPPGIGSYSSDVTITTNAGIRTIHVRAQGVPDSGRIALSRTVLDLGSVTAGCDSSAGSFSFTNTTCQSVTVDSVSAASNAFVRNALALPRVLATDSSMSVRIGFSPQSAGAFSSSVHLYYHTTTGAHDTAIALQGIGTAGPQLGMQLESAPLAAEAGATATLSLDLTGGMTAAQAAAIGVTAAHATVALNTDLLTPLDVSTPIPGATVTMQPKPGGADITLNLPMGFTYSATTHAVDIRCRAFVTDTMTTTAKLIASTFDASRTCYTVQSQPSSTAFTLAPRCSDSTISKTLAHGLPFAIESIVPNPTTGMLQVRIIGKQQLEYAIYDLLGREVRTGALQGRLDLHALPSGSYYLRITDGVYAQTRRVGRE